MSTTIADTAAFDAYAQQYEQALHAGLSVSGESPEYFARKRIEWTHEVLRTRTSIKRVLDFGCGIGLAVPLIREVITPQFVSGFDPSRAAINRAREELGNNETQFVSTADQISPDAFDLVYCNGVFHHIEPEGRPAALQTVYQSLRPGGWFVLWENNPWNPGTRLVMSRIPFDRDAVVISPVECRHLLRAAGFHVEQSDAWFLFPRVLGWLRPLERLVHRLPLGAQYVVFAQKPAEDCNL